LHHSIWLLILIYMIYATLGRSDFGFEAKIDVCARKCVIWPTIGLILVGFVFWYGFLSSGDVEVQSGLIIQQRLLPIDRLPSDGESVIRNNVAQLPLLSPFEKLEGGKDIHADGSDADCPFSVSGEVEDREHQQQDTRQYPGGVANDSEEGKAAADLRALGIETNQCRVPKHDNREGDHQTRRCAEEISEWFSGEHEEKPAGE